MEHGKVFFLKAISELFLKKMDLQFSIYLPTYRIYLKKCYKFMKVLYNFIVQSMS